MRPGPSSRTGREARRCAHRGREGRVVGSPQARRHLLNLSPNLSPNLSNEAAAALGPHDVAVVLGSGWSAALERLPAATADVSVTDLPGFAPPPRRGTPGGCCRFRWAGGACWRSSEDTTCTSSATSRRRTCREERCRRRLSCCRADERLRVDGGRDAARTDRADPRPHQHDRGVTARRRPVRRPHRSLLVATAHALPRHRFVTVRGGVRRVLGADYETPVEIRVLDARGDLVGMSTVLEAIAADVLGVEVLGLSLVTDRAVGLGGPLHHDEVLAVGPSGNGSCTPGRAPRPRRAAGVSGQVGWLSSMRLPEGSRTKA